MTGPGFGWGEWARVPTLPRRDLQARADSLWAARLPAGHGARLTQSTTGSTGRPLRFGNSEHAQFVAAGLMLREHLWRRRDARGRLAIVRASAREGEYATWGAPVAELWETGPALVLDVRHDVDAQIERLRAFAPDYLLTYASNAHALARRVLERGIADLRLRELRVFGELCRPDLAELCREAFGADLSDAYSAEETGPIASQCPEQGRYHVHADSVLLEVLDERDRPCPPGSLGRVVVTPLHNFAMPLLRYDLGDYAAAGEPCACGRALPVLARIAGRRRNMLRLPGGGSRWPSFPASVWLPFPAITRVQLAQLALDRVEVRVEATRDLEAGERARLFEVLGRRLGADLRFDLRRVERIGRADDHKFEDFVSLLGESS